MSPSIWSVSDGGNGHSYQVITVPWGFTREDAEKAAKKSGGYLATITSEAENYFIYKLICKNKDLWVIDGSGNGSGPWIGGYKKEGKWKWVTEEKFKYSSWASGEPNNYKGTEDSMCFYRPGMKDKPFWNDISKDTVLPACIVEFDKPK